MEREMELEQRIERLERQNRWSRTMAVIALAGAGLMLTLGQPQAMRANTRADGTVEASEFVLVDKNGTKCMSIANVDGVTMLNLWGTGGDSNARAGILACGSDAYFWAKGPGARRGTLYLRATEKESHLDLRNAGDDSAQICSPNHK
jgi:hypothetical protein